MTLHFLRLALATAAVCLAGCYLPSAGPTQHESRTIERDKSEMLRVDLRMGAGELKVRGGARKLMEADFTYNVPSLRPEVRYSSVGFRGNLAVEQQGRSTSVSNVVYRWDLRLADDIPMDLTVNFGAGEARLELGSAALRSLNVNMGVGQLDLDLRGTPRRDYSVQIHGGVGEATIRLPKDAGIVADATGGIGGISARGLRQEGGRYVSEGYQHAKVTIHLTVRGGVGAINLIAD